MDKTFKDRWENILTNASLALLDTTIDYHKHCIQDTQYKLQHRKNELKKRCDDDTAQKLINKTDMLYMKYTERSLLALNKTTKRLERLENTSTRLQQRPDNLLIARIHRGYKHDNIITSFNKAILYTQNELLNKTENANKTTNKPIFTTQYNSNTKYIAQILRKHWNVIENDPTLQILWPEPPIVAYQKNKSLRDTLVSAKLN